MDYFKKSIQNRGFIQKASQKKMKHGKIRPQAVRDYCDGSNVQSG